jgi:hypothetical protein
MTISFYFQCSTVGQLMLQSLLQSQNLRSILMISLQSTTQPSQVSLSFRSSDWYLVCSSSLPKTEPVITDPEDVIAKAQHKFFPLHRMTQYPFKNKRWTQWSCDTVTHTNFSWEHPHSTTHIKWMSQLTHSWRDRNALGFCWPKSENWSSLPRSIYWRMGKKFLNM